MKRRTVILAASAAGLLTLGLGSGAAFGASQAVPDSSGVIHGCYKPSGYATGALMVIDTDAGQSCPSDTTAVNWNQTGPAGPSTAGPTGLDSTVVIEQTTSTEVRVNCPGDHPYVTGGGVWQNPATEPAPVLDDRPTNQNAQDPNNGDWTPGVAANAWTVTIASNPEQSGWSAYAICVK